MVDDPLEEIHTFTRAVARGEVSCDVETCLRCGERPAIFCLHDRRKRIFLVILDRLVHEVLSLLPRWRCPLCEGTFTIYPAFALPWKRYVRKEILRFSERYVTEDQTSYRNAATKNLQKITANLVNETMPYAAHRKGPTSAHQEGPTPGISVLTRSGPVHAHEHPKPFRQRDRKIYDVFLLGKENAQLVGPFY